MDDLDEIELTEEDIDKYIPYRNEIQDILEQEDHAENWLRFFVKTKSDLFNLFKILTNSDNVEYFELDQK